ncbi:FadR/GntR family transcriptional regulator [Lentibacillus sediminis]|uniref:FadR/GntR family transcriptional regulator n=1 Tax=Lentibacillus sediminis TaxID=1940529 RepID=UPI000C1BEE84|nr:FadR/GntR family transcriptional regulator [Lentibacillus sediminis]
MIEPVKRLNVTDSIVNQIKELILQGKLKQGDKLPPERELMNKFDVGRPSLREALKVLESQGLIQRLQRGTIISGNHHTFFSDSLMFQLYFSASDWQDIFESRRFIERELTTLAAERATEEDMTEMKEAITEMKAAIHNRNNTAYIASNIRFHEKIAQSSKNKVMYNLFKSIDNLVSQMQEQTVTMPGVMNDSLKFHQKILKAIRQRDAEKAGKLMVEHIQSVYGFLQGKDED